MSEEEKGAVKARALPKQQLPPLQDENDDNPERSRERNRIHARISRLRKKMYIQAMKQEVEHLTKEHHHLRGVFQQQFGQSYDEFAKEREPDPEAEKLRAERERLASELSPSTKRVRKRWRLEPEERVERSRERNRVHAKKSRQRKKLLINELKECVAEMAKDNQEIKRMLETRLGPAHPALQLPPFQFNPSNTADISEIEHALNLARRVRSGAIPSIPGLPLVSSLASLGAGLSGLGGGASGKPGSLPLPLALLASSTAASSTSEASDTDTVTASVATDAASTSMSVAVSTSTSTTSSAQPSWQMPSNSLAAAVSRNLALPPQLAAALGMHTPLGQGPGTSTGDDTSMEEGVSTTASSSTTTAANAESILGSLPVPGIGFDMDPSLAQMFSSGVTNMLPPPDVRAQVEAHLRTVRQSVAQRPFGCRAGTAVSYTASASSAPIGSSQEGFASQRSLPPGIIAPGMQAPPIYSRLLSGRNPVPDTALTAALFSQVLSMGSAASAEPASATSTVATEAASSVSGSQPGTVYDALAAAMPNLTQSDFSAFLTHRGALQAMASGALTSEGSQAGQQSEAPAQPGSAEEAQPAKRQRIDIPAGSDTPTEEDAADGNGETKDLGTEEIE